LEAPLIAVNWIPPTGAAVAPELAQAETATNNSGALVPLIAGDSMVDTDVVVSSVAPPSWGEVLLSPLTSKRQAPI